MGTEERTCVEVGKQTVAENPAELVIKSFCSISPAVFQMHLMALRMMLFTKKRLKVEKVRMQMTN